MELMTGFGLATAAGLNAYIPLLLMGVLGRFTSAWTLADRSASKATMYPDKGVFFILL